MSYQSLIHRHRTHLPPAVATVAAVALLTLLAACTSDTESDDVTLATGVETELDVMVYNIEYEGGPETDAVIEAVDADIVGVLESYDRLPEIAENTGYDYYNVGLQILSKYPIHEPSGADGLYALIEIQPGYAVAFFNTHLDYVKYGPKLVTNGVPVADAIASENEVRTSSLQIQMPQMKTLAAAGYPVFLTGDFNQPSSLDYADITVGTRPGINEAIAWPVSEALFDIGFRDTYREIYPNPVDVPGLTKDNPDFRKGGAGDRIDFVYAGGPSTTVSSELIGERGGADVDTHFMPWTSDHRAVVSTFEATPVALPTTVSLASRMLTEGDSLEVYVNAPGSSSNSIEVLPEEAPSDPVASQDGVGETETLSIDTTSMAPGGYNIQLMDSEGNELATNQFWVRSAEAAVALSTEQTEYPRGRAGHRRLGRRSSQPLGLDRHLRGR